MDYVLFDLDGTITNSQKGITNSVAYALDYFGIEDKGDLSRYIGPPLRESFMRLAGLSQEQSHTAMTKYREYYGSKGIFENEVYEGIPEVLKECKAKGKRVVLATSKPWIYAEIILEHFDIKKYFDVVVGSELNGVRTKKDEVIKYAIDKYGIDVNKAIMVGDREHDILGANKNGLKTIGVLFGFGDRNELENVGADFIAEKPLDILNYID